MTDHHLYYTSFHTSVHSNAHVTPAGTVRTSEHFRFFGGVNSRHISIKATPLPNTKRSPSQSPSKAPLVAPWHSLFLRHLDRILCSSPGDLCAWGWGARDGRAEIWGLLAWTWSSFSLSHPPPPPPPLLDACPLGGQRGNNKHRGAVYSS